jgi:adenylate cyclase
LFVVLAGGWLCYGKTMTEKELDSIRAWLTRAGLDGMAEQDLLAGMCQRCREAGVNVARALALIDTLHPTWEGRAFRWHHDNAQENVTVEYGPTTEGDRAEAWQRSPFRHMLETNTSEFRRRASDRQDVGSYAPLLKSFSEGQTDYFAMIHRFAPAGSIGQMDCSYAQFTTEHGEGFSEREIEVLRRLMPTLSLAVKCTAMNRIAGTLAEVYLGRDAGRQVLAGRITRGVAERIHAVLWFSDLKSFTTIADGAAPDQIIPLLNDYAEAVIAAVQAEGGDVMKLIGDGVLAMFKAEDSSQAVSSALRAGRAMRQNLGRVDTERAAQGLPTTTVNLGLHIGEVFYGNIGSDTRLDFTVVGPAVNEVSRIVALCRSVDRPILLSSDLIAAMSPQERAKFVSVGRYALRGVGRAQELYTLDPELALSPSAEPEKG